MRREIRGDCEEMIIERHNRVLSSISHDLKSPMNAILGITSLLLDNADMDIGKREDFLRRIFGAGKETLKLVEEILAMAKMEAGREKVEPSWVYNLGAELAEVISTFHYEAEAKGIGLSLAADESLPAVRWDMRRIRLHVLNNLVSNALKFTPAGGEVTLSAQAGPDAVTLKVEDTGPGVPMEEAERIFERFEHGAMTSARVFAGAGLGLHNARLFTERSGGRIYLDSPPGDGGASFVIELPVDSWFTIAGGGQMTEEDDLDMSAQGIKPSCET